MAIQLSVSNSGTTLTATATGLEMSNPNEVYALRVYFNGAVVAWALAQAIYGEGSMSYPGSVEVTKTDCADGVYTIALFYSDDNGAEYSEVASTTYTIDNRTHYTATSVPTGTRWYRAVIVDGDTTTTTNLESETLAVPQLQPPTDITFSNIDDGSADISWTNVEHATDYYMRYGTSNPPTGDGAHCYSGAMVAPDLSRGTTYYVQVRSIGDGTNYTNSDWSSVATFTTTGTATTTVVSYSATMLPTGTRYYRALVVDDNTATTTTNSDMVTLTGIVQLSAPELSSDNTATTITPTWSAVTNASSYLLRYGTANPPTGDGSAWVSGTAITGLTYGTTYYLQAKAVGDGVSYSDSDWGDIVSVTTGTVTPDPDPIVMTYTATNVPTGQRWYRAIVVDGDSTTTTSRDTVTLTVPAPPVPTATAISQYAVYVQWSSYDGTLALQRSITGTDTWATVATGLTGRYYIDTTVPEHVVCHYRLVASGDTVSPTDPAWLSTIHHYVVVAEAHAGIAPEGDWIVIAETNV